MHSELDSDMRQASDQLKQEWGAAYDDKLTAARSALQAYGDDDFVAMLEKTGLGDSPHMIKAFAKIGENLSEDVAKNHHMQHSNCTTILRTQDSELLSPRRRALLHNTPEN